MCSTLISMWRMPKCMLLVPMPDSYQKDVITEFRGRGWEIRIHPLSFSEYYEVVGGEERQALETYYLYGGLPAVAQIETPEAKQNYLREIYETVYLEGCFGA